MNHGDVEDSIQGGICKNISSWLLICHSVRSPIIKAEGLRQSKVLNGSYSCVYLQIKLFCISAGNFQLCKDHFPSFPFLLPEWEQGAQGHSFFLQRCGLCAHLDLVTFVREISLSVHGALRDGGPDRRRRAVVKYWGVQPGGTSNNWVPSQS